MSKSDIFISWSGPDSREVAARLKDFLSAVYPTISVFLSTEDIGSGERWLSVVSSALETSVFGITIVTPQNITRPWIYFEAGAISKSVESSRLVPLLCGLTPVALRDTPLSGFQAETLEKEGISSLVKAIRDATGYPIEEARLQESFDVWWGRKGDKLVDASHFGTGHGSEPEPLTLEDIYGQISDLEGYVRDLDRVIRDRVPETVVIPPSIGRGLFGGGRPTAAQALGLAQLFNADEKSSYLQALQASIDASAPAQPFEPPRPPEEDPSAR